MKNISIVREFNDNENALSIKNKVSRNAIKDNEKILKYLKSFEPFCAAGMSLIDEITGEITSLGVNGYEDGEFVWDIREIYHFEKYNLQFRR